MPMHTPPRIYLGPHSTNALTIILPSLSVCESISCSPSLPTIHSSSRRSGLASNSRFPRHSPAVLTITPGLLRTTDDRPSQREQATRRLGKSNLGTFSRTRRNNIILNSLLYCRVSHPLSTSTSISHFRF